MAAVNILSVLDENKGQHRSVTGRGEARKPTKLTCDVPASLAARRQSLGAVLGAGAVRAHPHAATDLWDLRGSREHPGQEPTTKLPLRKSNSRRCYPKPPLRLSHYLYASELPLDSRPYIAETTTRTRKDCYERHTSAQTASPCSRRYCSNKALVSFGGAGGPYIPATYRS